MAARRQGSSRLPPWRILLLDIGDVKGPKGNVNNSGPTGTRDWIGKLEPTAAYSRPKRPYAPPMTRQASRCSQPIGRGEQPQTNPSPTNPHDCALALKVTTAVMRTLNRPGKHVNTGKAASRSQIDPCLQTLAVALTCYGSRALHALQLERDSRDPGQY